MAADDVRELLDHAVERLQRRLGGLTDEEWRWSPIGDPEVTAAWRVQHLTEMFLEPRNATWLQLHTDPEPAPAKPATASAALARFGRAYAGLRRALDDLTDDQLAAPIGPAAGRYGSASRLSFLLHLVDEVIHHAAETALLRDLYAGRAG